jgi:hypothetical protein
MGTYIQIPLKFLTQNGEPINVGVGCSPWLLDTLHKRKFHPKILLDGKVKHGSSNFDSIKSIVVTFVT